MKARTIMLGALCAALLVGGAGCTKPAQQHGGEAVEGDKEAFGRLSIPELSALMADAKAGKIKLAIFDNNQHERFDKSHLPGARWVDFSKVQASDLPPEKDATLVFYCANEH
jgi:hypothetical protein